MKTGIVVFAHGSSVESANEAVRMVTREFARSGGHEVAETAFLEGGQPDLAGGVEAVIAQGARRILVIPYFLTLGLHLKRDLPKLVDELVERYGRDIDVHVTAPLDGHPALNRILLDRAASAIAAFESNSI